MDFMPVLQAFNPSLNGTAVLSIMGNVVAVSMSPFLASYGAKRIIKGVQNAVHGNLGFGGYEERYSYSDDKLPWKSR